MDRIAAGFRHYFTGFPIDLRSRDGDHWTLEKVGETLGVDPCRSCAGCRRKMQVVQMHHLTSRIG